MDLILASQNKDKLKEIKSILFDLELNLLSLDEISLSNLKIVESGDTLSANAFIKAKTIFDIAKKPVISDDSGLFVPELSFEPGVHSSRYASEHASDQDNRLKLIRNIKKLNKRKLKAYFETKICFILNETENYYFTGRLDGYVIDNMRGDNGFGYDSVFYIEEKDKTLAEISSEMKNLISHRYKAMIEFKAFLETIIKREKYEN